MMTGVSAPSLYKIARIPCPLSTPMLEIGFK